MYMYIRVLICFEVWAKLAQQYRVQHWEYILSQITKTYMYVHVVNAVSDNLIIINCAIWPKERTVQCLIRSSLSRLWANGAPYELIENSDVQCTCTYVYTVAISRVWKH